MPDGTEKTEIVDTSALDDAKSAFHNASSVFEAQLESKETRAGVKIDQLYSDSPVFYTFHVLKTYKGPGQDSVVVISDNSSCGAAYGPDRMYIIYAHLNSDGQFVHKACMTNYVVAADSADLRFLRGEPPAEDDLLGQRERSRRDSQFIAESPGSITGLITLEKSQPVGKARVFIWDFHSKEKTYPLRQAKISILDDGHYQIEKLLPGSYIVGAASQGQDGGFYGGFSTSAQGAIQVGLGKMVQVDLVLERQVTARVHGKVFATGGEISPHRLTLVPSAQADANQIPWEGEALVGSDGSFEFAGVPAGYYELRLFPEKGMPFLVSKSSEFPWGVMVEVKVPRGEEDVVANVVAMVRSAPTPQ